MKDYNIRRQHAKRYIRKRQHHLLRHYFYVSQGVSAAQMECEYFTKPGLLRKHNLTHRGVWAYAKSMGSSHTRLRQTVVDLDDVAEYLTDAQLHKVRHLDPEIDRWGWGD